MKTKKILISILILIVALLMGTVEAQAANAEIYASKSKAEVGDEITITAKFTAAAWNLKVSGNGIGGASYASQTSDLSEAENVKTFKLDTSKAGQYTISITGDITDANGYTKEISKNCTVTINEKPVTPEPEKPIEKPIEKPTETQKPEPEKPNVEEKPNFTDTNKTMYASKDINLRASWSTNSKATSINKGTELKVTATSSNKVNGYIWYRVSFNGQTLYVASNLVTTTKPEEEKVQDEKPVEEPKEEPEVIVEEPTNKEEEDKLTTTGLKKLEIEGLKLTPTFNSGIYEYRVIVKENISELKINAESIIENATITIAGNENLVEGENLITIIIYNAKKEVEATYQITVNKSTLDLRKTDKMLQLGTKQATRNLIIFIAAFAIAIIVLIVILLLKRRNNYEYYDEEEEELTDFRENVENIPSNTAEKSNTENKKEKRKGKHF